VTLAEILNADPQLAAALSRTFPGGVTPINPGPVPRTPTAPVAPVPQPGDRKGGRPPSDRDPLPPVNPDVPPRTPVTPPPPPTNPDDWDRDPTLPPRNDLPPMPGDKGQPSPTPLDPWGYGQFGPGTGGDFAKGQVRPEQMPGGIFEPFAQALYGSGFNPYAGNASGGGGTNGGRPAPLGSAYSYDPYGIGQNNYGGGSYPGMPGSAQNLYGMTGVNAATGYQGPARYGVVGGQGGYGIGMVGPEYSGPLFDDAKGALKAMRRQRRELNAPIKAAAAPAPAAAPAGGTDVNQKGQPAQQPVGGSTAPPSPKGQPGQQMPASLASNMSGPGVTTPQQQMNALQQGWNIQPGSGPNGTVSFTGGNSFYDTPYGRVTTASGGDQNVFKAQGGGEGPNDPLFHFNPNAGWQSMTGADYRGAGNAQYANPAQYQNDPRLGAQQHQFQLLPTQRR